MDIEQDLQFLDNFEHSSLQQTFLALNEENQKLKLDNKRKFDIISKQADVIKRYRTVLQSVHHIMKESPNTDLENVAPKEENKEQKTSNEENKEYKIPTAEIKAGSSGDPKIHQPTDSGELCRDRKVKYPQDGDMPNCTDIAEGQFVWNAIVHTFNTSYGGSVTSEMMLKAFPGINKLTGKPALTTEMMDKYFRTSFTIAPGERTFTVRPFVNAHRRMWIIMMPKWLNNEYRS